MKKIICTFLGQQSNQSEQSLTCTIAYGPCPTSVNSFKGTPRSPNTVVIDLPPDHQSSEQCYTIIASNNTFTVAVRGKMGKNYNILCMNRHQVQH